MNGNSHYHPRLNLWSCSSLVNLKLGLHNVFLTCLSLQCGVSAKLRPLCEGSCSEEVYASIILGFCKIEQFP